MTDLISRKMLIKALERRSGVDWDALLILHPLLRVIENLPISYSIVRCGECEYSDAGIDEDGKPFLKCLNGRSYGGTYYNDFCSWSKRRDQDERNH